MSGYQRFLLWRGFSSYKLWVLRIVIPRIADAIPRILPAIQPPPPPPSAALFLLQNNQYQRVGSRETLRFVCLLVETQTNQR